MTADHPYLLSEQVAIITGGSRGIGKAIAITLAQRGASVVINYLNSTSQAEVVVETIRSNGGTAVAIQADVSDFIQASELISKTVEKYSKVNILINNAGITRDQFIMRFSEDDWDEVLQVNLKSTFNCSKAAIKSMMRHRYGRIINISSVSGLIGNAGQTAYSASKAGQIGFTKALAREVAPRNITVNAIAAGFIDTELWANVPDNFQQNLLNMIPLNRKGLPSEVANVVAFFASQEAGYITGQCLAVDGGLTMV